MATQVSTTRASRSPSLGLGFPMPLKGFGRVREGPRFQSPPNPPGLMSCPASPLREQPLWAKPPTLTITVPSGPPLGGPGHLQPGGTPSPPVSTGAPSSLSPSSPSFPGGNPAEPHVTRQPGGRGPACGAGPLERRGDALRWLRAQSVYVFISSGQCFPSRCLCAPFVCQTK